MNSIQQPGGGPANNPKADEPLINMGALGMVLSFTHDVPGFVTVRFDTGTILFVSFAIAQTMQFKVDLEVTDEKTIFPESSGWSCVNTVDRKDPGRKGG